MNKKKTERNWIGQQINGDFFVKNPERKLSKNNRTYYTFEIKVGLLPVKVIAWKDSCTELVLPCHGKTMSLNGEWNYFHGHWQIKCLSLNHRNRESIEITQAKTRLRVLLSWMPNNNLKKFLVRILNDVSIAKDFSHAPASLKHHHAFPGGLLVHSVDVAWQVFSYSKLSEHERYLGTVAGLLHDIGKLKTLSCDMTRTRLGVNLDHEQLSLEVISDHLAWLDLNDSELSIAIRYLLSWKPKGFDRILKLDVYEVIKTADRVSAGSAVS